MLIICSFVIFSALCLCWNATASRIDRHLAIGDPKGRLTVSPAPKAREAFTEIDETAWNHFVFGTRRPKLADLQAVSPPQTQLTYPPKGYTMAATSALFAPKGCIFVAAKSPLQRYIPDPFYSPWVLSPDPGPQGAGLFEGEDYVILKNCRTYKQLERGTGETGEVVFVRHVHAIQNEAIPGKQNDTWDLRKVYCRVARDQHRNQLLVSKCQTVYDRPELDG